MGQLQSGEISQALPIKFSHLPPAGNPSRKIFELEIEYSRLEIIQPAIESIKGDGVLGLPPMVSQQADFPGEVPIIGA